MPAGRGQAKAGIQGLIKDRPAPAGMAAQGKSPFPRPQYASLHPPARYSADQAEILAKGQSDLYERLVTRKHFEFTLKHELEKLRAELKNEIEKLRAELKSDIDKVQANLEQVKAELKHDIATVKAELQHQLDEHKAANSQALKELELTLKHELETVKTELKRDIKEMEQKLTIKLGAFLAISVTILAALIKFLQAPTCPCTA